MAKICVVLILNGFETQTSLVGLGRAGIELLFQVPIQRVAVGYWIKQLEGSRTAGTSGLAGQSLQPADVTVSTTTLVAQLSDAELQATELDIAQRAAEMDVTPFDKSLAPRKAVQELAAAQQCGHSVECLLADRAVVMRIESAKKSLPSIRSALKCWHEFATLVLAYPAGSTLPPRGDADIFKYVAMFRQGKTASNYINSLRWRASRIISALKGDPRTLSWY